MTSVSKTAPEQFAPEPAADLPDPVLQVVSDLIAEIGSRISAEMIKAEQSEVPRLREALVAMRESVRRELSESLRDEFEARFRESMEIAKGQFSQKLQEATASLEEERNRLRVELTATRKSTNEISAELLSKQSELEHLNRETASMLEDPDIELSTIIRHKALVSDLSAYIKGLQYLSGEAE